MTWWFWVLVLVQWAIEIGARIGGKKTLNFVKSRMIKKIPDRLKIEVPEGGHFVRGANAEKNISFNVRFIKTYPMPMNINRIDYSISYENKVIQQKIWDESIEMKRSEIERRIDLIYYSLESPSGIPALPNKWGIKGNVCISCAYGEMTIPFASTKYITVTCDGSWDDVRKN